LSLALAIELFRAHLIVLTSMVFTKLFTIITWAFITRVISN
jgi:hypothetical protein